MRKYVMILIFMSIFFILNINNTYASTNFSNSEVLQAISDYYNMGIENYQILTGYSNSYTTYTSFMSQLDNYKYFMCEYIVNNNSATLYIYYGDKMWFDLTNNCIRVVNARSGQFIQYENYQGGRTKKSVLRNIISYSSSQFPLDTTTQKYYIFNCATSTSYNDYFAKQGGFSGDEIFNIVNNNGDSTINQISTYFEPYNNPYLRHYLYKYKWWRSTCI